MATKINFKEMFYIYRVVLIILFLKFTCGCAGAKEDENSVTNPMPLDKSIRYGRLPNGFTYYIKSLPEPQDNLYMRFYNKVGSYQENAEWLDVAHGVEHLAFKATRNFPEGIDGDVIMKKAGAYNNASSGARVTTYKLDIPVGHEKVIGRGLQWFKDIANGLMLKTSDIQQVNGELRQEELERAGDLTNVKRAKSELNRHIFPCRHDDSNFLQYFDSAKPTTYRTFYNDWYRPDLLAVSIVGNIKDIDELEQKIINNFSALQTPAMPKKPKDCDSIYYNRKPLFAKIERAKDSLYFSSDKLVNLNLYFPDPKTSKNLSKQKGLERLILLSLLNEIASDRLDEATMEYSSFDVGMINTYREKEFPITIVISAELDNTPVKAALKKIIDVLRQLGKSGITASEFERLKKKHGEYMDLEKDENGKYWVNQIGKYITSGEALPSGKLRLRKNYLENLTLEDLNDFLYDFFSVRPKDVGLIAPIGNPALSITKKEIRGKIKEIYEDPVPEYRTLKVPDYLLDPDEVAKLDEVKVLKKEEDDIGAFHLQLSNGVNLIYKQLNPDSGMYEDNILIHGFTLKGTNCIAKEDLLSAVTAPHIIANSGVNNMDRFEIGRFLKTKGINPRSGVISSYVDKNDSGIQAVSSVNNLEVILQLIYLNFTRPNKDTLAFRDWKAAMLKAPKNIGQEDYRLSIRSTMGDSSKVRLNMLGNEDLLLGTKDYQRIDEINLNTSYNIYKSIFGNATDFTFVISGKAELNEVLPILKKYLGNLPGSSSPFQKCLSKKTISELPKGPVFQVIPSLGDYNLPNIKYSINYLKKSVNPGDWKEQLKVEALGHVTTHKAWRLRYKKNYSLYSVSVGGRYNSTMNRYQVGGTFECIPEEFPLIRKEMHKIVSELKAGKLTEEEFKEGMAWMYGFYGPDGFGGEHFILHKNLYKHYRYGEAWVTPEKLDSFVKSLSVKDIVDTARDIYQKENRYEYIMSDKKLDTLNF